MNKGTAIVGFLLSFLAGMGLMCGVDQRQGVDIGAERRQQPRARSERCARPRHEQGPAVGQGEPRRSPS